MRVLISIALAGCQAEEIMEQPLSLRSTDVSISSGFADFTQGHWTRGRACAPLDVDSDGLLDLYVASPGDGGWILQNKTPDSGQLTFEAGQVLSLGDVPWSAAAVDYDADGDTDLFVGHGGNEQPELDTLWVNEDGTLVPISTPPVSGPYDLFDEPIPQATAGVAWTDFNLDGHLDIWASTNILDESEVLSLNPEQPHGRDRLLLGDGTGGYIDEGFEAGLDKRTATFNSTVFDMDNDGDSDIFLNVLVGKNRLYRNELVETGTLHFTDVTEAYSLGEPTLENPRSHAFSSAPADFNGDGFLDLIVWHRGPTGPMHTRTGHVIWLNLSGEGFVEVSDYTGINERWDECEAQSLGVMGSQVADLNLDGLPDVFIGNGAPPSGCHNQLWLSNGIALQHVPGVGVLRIPKFRDASLLIDFAPEGVDDVPFPYRTHGTCIADYDRDGLPELAFVNGGPGWAEDTVREPNRLFDFNFIEPRQSVSLTLRGDGDHVNVDAVGSRVRLLVRNNERQETWSVHGHVLAGQGFASMNALELLLGIGDADEIVSGQVWWPDGVRDDLPTLTPGQTTEITR